MDPAHTYTVTMSYIQVYMEMIQDLLHPESDNLVSGKTWTVHNFVLPQIGVKEREGGMLSEGLM